MFKDAAKCLGQSFVLFLRCLWTFIRVVLASRIFIVIYYTICYAMIAINPNIWKNPFVFGQYVFFTICGLILQFVDNKKHNKEMKKLEDRISALENDKKEEADENTMDK